MANSPYIVRFDETGEEREVVRLCWKCGDSYRWTPFRTRADAPIVSPSGIGHLGHWSGSERTACGKDATREGWWHKS